MFTSTIFILTDFTRKYKITFHNENDMIEEITSLSKSLKIENYFVILDTGEKYTSSNLKNVCLNKEKYEILIVDASFELENTRVDVAFCENPQKKEDFLDLKERIDNQISISSIIEAYMNEVYLKMKKNEKNLTEEIGKNENFYKTIKESTNEKRYERIKVKVNLISKDYEIGNESSKVFDFSYIFQLENSFLEKYSECLDALNESKKKMVIDEEEYQVNKCNFQIKRLTGQEKEYINQVKSYSNMNFTKENKENSGIFSELLKKSNQNKEYIDFHIKQTKKTKTISSKLGNLLKQIKKTNSELEVIDEILKSKDVLIQEIKRRKYFDFNFEELINFLNVLLVSKEKEKRKRFVSFLPSSFKCEYGKVVLNKIFENSNLEFDCFNTFSSSSNILGKVSSVDNENCNYDYQHDKDVLENLIFHFFDQKKLFFTSKVDKQSQANQPEIINQQSEVMNDNLNILLEEYMISLDKISSTLSFQLKEHFFISTDYNLNNNEENLNIKKSIFNEDIIIKTRKIHQTLNEIKQKVELIGNSLNEEKQRLASFDLKNISITHSNIFFDEKDNISNTLILNKVNSQNNNFNYFASNQQAQVNGHLSINKENEIFISSFSNQAKFEVKSIDSIHLLNNKKENTYTINKQLYDQSKDPDIVSIIKFYKAIYNYLQAFISSHADMLNYNIDYNHPVSIGKFISKLVVYCENARNELRKVQKVLR